MFTKILTWAAIYLMIWWVTFFAVLPMGGNVSHHEAGVETQKGNDPGAPVVHNLGKKIRLNSLVALAVWLIVLIFSVFIRIPIPEIPSV
jgi:predicted secreted protein